MDSIRNSGKSHEQTLILHDTLHHKDILPLTKISQCLIEKNDQISVALLHQQQMKLSMQDVKKESGRKCNHDHLSFLESTINLIGESSLSNEKLMGTHITNHQLLHRLQL